MMTRRRLLFSLCAASGSGAQQTIFRSDTLLVLIDVQVTDRNTGRIIDSLVRDDFIVDDDGQRREIKFFDFGTTPLDLALLVDVSGSMIEASRAMVQTLRWALDDLGFSDRVALITFSNKPRVVLPLAESRARLLQEAERAVAHTSRLERGTRLYDALMTAGHLFRAEGKATTDRRRTILVVTDDKESRSKAKPEAVLMELLESDVTANAVVINTREPAGKRRITRLGIPIPGMPPMIDDRQSPGPKRVYLSMQQIATETGGEMTSRRERDDFLGEMFARIRARYLLGFYASTNAPVKPFHRLMVRLSSAKQKEYPRALVRARTGYYTAALKQN